MNAAVKNDTEIGPGAALAALLTHAGPVLIDFDETIYLRNSTEDFIDSARPALFAALLMRLLDVVKPWRWTGGELTRDVWRVRCILTLFPWTLAQWTKTAGELASTGANTPLIAALKRRLQIAHYQPVTIATLGFAPVVAPLVEALGLATLSTIAARATTFADRREGKLRLVAGRVGHDVIRRALVITDSTADQALLDACDAPLLIEWPQAQFRPAFSNLYLPGQYLTQIKRPGESYISRGILQEDYALWILASISLSTQPLAHIVGLAFLLLSFWAIYEAGYVDNDRIAAQFERNPKLSRTFGRATVATPRILPWIWAVSSGAIAVLLLRGLNTSAAYGMAAWSVLLAATYGVFALYNRYDKNTRIWWYCGLQLARSAAFVVLVPIHLVGAMAIGAHVLAKWIPYYLYRIGGQHWPEGSHFLTRLLFFVLLTLLMSFGAGFSSVWQWPTAALLAWNVFRARHELLSATLDAKRIDKPSVTSAPDKAQSPP